MLRLKKILSVPRQSMGLMFVQVVGRSYTDHGATIRVSKGSRFSQLA
jgi:hypothetical protein